jgi:hypothetical protein
MPTAFVETPDTRIRLRSARLVVQSSAGDDSSGEIRTLAVIPFAGLDQLAINERVQISTQALDWTTRRAERRRMRVSGVSTKAVGMP